MAKRCIVCGQMALISGPRILARNNQPSVSYNVCPTCQSIQRTQPTAMDDFKTVSFAEGDVPVRKALEAGQEIFRETPLIRYMEPGLVFNLESTDGLLASHWLSRGWKVRLSSLSDVSLQRALAYGIQERYNTHSQLLMQDHEERTPWNADALLSEGYVRLPNPIYAITPMVQALRKGAAVHLRGLDPTAKEVLQDNNEYLGYYVNVVPSGQQLISALKPIGLQILDWSKNGSELKLTFIKL